ncbi:MAG: G/U mismatch-specific DNA glycosylase [Planctomycetales bacterium]
MKQPHPSAWKPTPEQLEDARGETLRDVLAPGLDFVFCGINPSLYSAAVGRHFARPGNRFWPALHKAGFTERLLSPFEDEQLLDRGCGLSNMAPEATARADELSREQLRRGMNRLRRTVRRHRPRCVAFLGITAYRIGFDQPKAKIGRQPETIGDSIVWTLPNPSGLNAHYQLKGLAKLYREMRTIVTESDQDAP